MKLRHALSFDKSFLVAAGSVTCLLVADSTGQQYGLQAKALSFLPRSQQSDCQSGRDSAMKHFPQFILKGR